MKDLLKDCWDQIPDNVKTKLSLALLGLEEKEFELNLIKDFNRINSVNGINESLKKITEIGRTALGSHACTLIFVDTENKCFTIEACAGFDKEFEEYIAGNKFKLGPLREGYSVDIQLALKEAPIEMYNLQQNPQGIANAHIVKKYRLGSALCHPLKLEDRLIGYFNHFSFTSEEWFSMELRRKLRIFSECAVLAIERLILERSLGLLNDLLKNIHLISSTDFFDQVAAKACDLLSVPISVVWKVEEKKSKLVIVATTGNVDDKFRRIELNLTDEGIRRHLSSKNVGYLANVSEPSKMYRHYREAKKRNWISLLSAPMWLEDNLVGMIDVYTKKPRYFKLWEKELFNSFANHAALAIQKAELLKASMAIKERQKQHERERIVSAIRKAIDHVRDKGISAVSDKGELGETLNIIVKECAIATDFDSCCLRLWNKSTDQLEIRACYEISNRIQDLSDCYKRNTDQAVAGLVVKTGESYISADTSQYPIFAKLSTNSSLICSPIKSGDAVIGTITVAGNKEKEISQDKKLLLESIVESISIAIERAILNDCLLRLAETTAKSKSLEELYSELAHLTPELMREPVCIVWEFDKNLNGFCVKALESPTGAPDDMQEKIKKLFISRTSTGIDRFLRREQPLYFKDVSRIKTHPYYSIMKELEFRSMLSMPLKTKDRPIGIIEIYSYKKERNFTNWNRKLFKTFAAQASLSIEELSNRQRFEQLNRIMIEMTKTRDKHEVLRLLFDYGCKLVGSARGWISTLDYATDQLRIVSPISMPPKARALKLGTGITGMALELERPIRVDNVHDPKWQGIYEEFWKDTQSELAVPILLTNAKIKKGIHVKVGTKPIGVINIESPTQRAFSRADKNIVWSLAKHAAILIERLESEQKFTELSEFEKEIVGKQNWDSVINTVLDAITKNLGFDYVNISLVNSESNEIKTEYVIGYPDEEGEEFKKAARHSLDSDDIQADIVRKRQIEVPSSNDPRLDPYIQRRFGHDSYLRVYIPMVSPNTNKVMGTVEAGYGKCGRRHIYEQDVQFLKGFVDYLVLVYENKTRMTQIEKITHEFSGPIVSVRGNTSFLQRHFDESPRYLIRDMFNNTFLNCETLLYQVKELQYILGKSPPPSQIGRLDFYEDVILRTINQLTPVLRENNISEKNIYIDKAGLRRIGSIYGDKMKLNQAVYNILINSIDYSTHDLNDFKIHVSGEEKKNEFHVKFRDWGVGIKKGLEEQVFDEGFRTREAANRNVTGSGLGLSISRQIMVELGGNLILAKNKNPTEFWMILPKQLKEMPL